MQHGVCRYDVVRQRDLHYDGLFIAGIDSIMSDRTDVLRIHSQYKAIPTAKDCCSLGRVGQRNHRFTGQEDNPSRKDRFVSMIPWEVVNE